MRDKGETYPTWVLDQAGVEIALVNASRLGPGQIGQHFRWVPYADALISPLTIKRYNLNELIKAVGVNDLPATLDDYTAKAVTPILERWKRGGALAVKFIAAYRRSLDFADVDPAEAQRIYSKYIRGGEPPKAEYKALQDFLFRYIAREAGRMELPVHIHTGSGNGPYFNKSNANPRLT